VLATPDSARGCRSVSDATDGPQLLPPNQIEHFNRGGDRITALRGGSGGLYRPEEWIASVTTAAGHSELGLSRLRDGALLRDAIAADPAGWLGEAHVEAYGVSPWRAGEWHLEGEIDAVVCRPPLPSMGGVAGIGSAPFAGTAG
jgi:hypothetical protein